MSNSHSEPAERIEDLEARIEDLGEAIARSRRLGRAGRAAAIAGPALLVCLVFGVLDLTPVRMIAAIALGLGGLVLMGSSRASTDQLEQSLRRAESERRAAIDALDLIEVERGAGGNGR
ncbi:MAG: hypothetical protein JO288_21885 [Hyphomicrobiales bacterium]|nr:hypothetical protein [Hyphomicrobiales bacterium]